MASPRPRPIRGVSPNLPAALQRAAPPKEEPPAEPRKRELFLTLVVKHPKLYEHIRDNCFLVGEMDGLDIKCFVVLDDPKHPLAQGSWNIRQWLVQSGLASPEQAGMSFPVQLDAGLPDRSDE